MIESKQIQIVEGALKLFFERGFHPTTIREIADACNMSMGQLYHYISSKDDVLYLVHQYFHTKVFEFIKTQNIEQYDTPSEKLISFIKANMTFASENKKLIQFISTETKYLKKDYLTNVLKMEQETTIFSFRKMLEDVNKEISSTDLEILASILTYIVAFLPLKSWTVKGKSINDIDRCLFDFILNGLGQAVQQKTEKLLD